MTGSRRFFFTAVFLRARTRPVRGQMPDFYCQVSARELPLPHAVARLFQRLEIFRPHISNDWKLRWKKIRDGGRLARHKKIFQKFVDTVTAMPIFLAHVNGACLYIVIIASSSKMEKRLERP
jgi:hypothetical protein